MLIYIVSIFLPDFYWAISKGNDMAKKSKINYQIIVWAAMLYILISRGLKLEIVKARILAADGSGSVIDLLEKIFNPDFVIYVEVLFLILLFVALSEEAIIYKKVYIKKVEGRSRNSALFFVIILPLFFLVLFVLSHYSAPKLFYGELGIVLFSYLYFPEFIFSIPKVFPKLENTIHKVMITRHSSEQLNSFGYDTLQKREQVLNARTIGHSNDPIYFTTKLDNGTVVYNGNPRRSNLIVGSAGAGKSVSILNPWIWQSMDMQIPMFLYDFKFPVQTRVALYHYLQLKKNNPNYPLQFHMNTFNGDYLHNVWRLSPINDKTIETDLHSDVYIQTLFSCMNKRWIKHPDFWAESTIAYGSAVTLAFKKYMGSKFTLPHIIHFLSQDYMKQVQVLINLDDDQINAKIENIRKPVMENKGADQLSGIFSTMQNFMSKMHNANIFFAISKEETSLDLNNPQSPTFLCVGNDNFYRKVFSPLISLYTSIVFSVCNKQGKLPLHFMADEAPTLYLPGVEDFINTGRSNGMITTLGMQSMAQTAFEYGQELARVIEGSLSNIYFGQTNDNHTQQFFSKMMGNYKKRVTHNTFQSNSNNVSLGETTHTENFLRQDEISELRKGYFAGKVAEGERSRFMGKVDVEEYLSHFDKSEELSLPLSPTVAMLEQDGKLKKDDINQYYQKKEKANQKINQETLKYADKVYQDIISETEQFIRTLV